MARDWICDECACASFEFDADATRQRLEDQAADEADDCERRR